MADHLYSYWKWVVIPVCPSLVVQEDSSGAGGSRNQVYETPRLRIYARRSCSLVYLRAHTLSATHAIDAQQVAAGNAGWRSQFRFADHVL